MKGVPTEPSLRTIVHNLSLANPLVTGEEVFDLLYPQGCADNEICPKTISIWLA